MQNDTDEDLRVSFEGQVGRQELEPGQRGVLGFSGCDYDAVVAYRVGGEEFAMLTDERLCEDGTLVVIRGQDDMVIEDQ